MAKKKNEKDVLIVRDEKTGEISVVAGLQADGTPRRTPPKMENAQDFLQFDKNGDMLDNFFRNFFRQCKEPSRFGFYRIAADQAENLLGVMKELLKDPVANAELLAPHKVDTSAYEKQVAQEQKAQEDKKQEQNQPSATTAQPKVTVQYALQKPSSLIEDVAEATLGAVGNLFQVGPGYDPQEAEFIRSMRKKKKKQIKPRF